ncbi:MAG: RAD55 family ATPase [Halobacteriaceae archaeon]
MSTTRLSTGVETLDRRFDGGLPAGSLFALVAPPEAQAELLVAALASARHTRYYSTARPAAEVAETTRRGDRSMDVVHDSPEALAADPESDLADLPAESNVVVDATNGFEELDRERYLDFLGALKRRLEETGGVGLLYCLAAEDAPRHRTLTLHRADVVARLELVRTTLTVETRLYVTKFRGGRALREPLKLALTDVVTVDTSRDIA